MGLYGNLIGGIIGVLISGIIAMLISSRAIKAERKKDDEEKLQDRKSLWLDEHWKKIVSDFEGIINFGAGARSLEGYDTTRLQTKLVTVDFFLESINCELKENWEGVNRNFKHSIDHLNTGYNNIYNSLQKLLEGESNYCNKLKETGSKSTKEITTAMRDQAKLKPKVPSGQSTLKYDEFDSKLILRYLICHSGDKTCVIEKTGNPSSYLANVNCPDCALSTQPDHLAIATGLNEKKYNNLIAIIKNIESATEMMIKEILDTKSNISQKEDEFITTINNIKKSYDAGHIIEGKCEICKNIYEEKNIIKLRPKI